VALTVDLDLDLERDSAARRGAAPSLAAPGDPPDDHPGGALDAGSAPPEDERPPLCPVCQKRLVILATQHVRAAGGERVRRQLWGCPRGHATAYRTAGRFSAIELLPDAGSW